MERALQWILVVAVCASSTINSAGIDETPHRKLANVDYSGIYFLCFLSTFTD